jgi:hypothetical protein
MQESQRTLSQDKIEAFYHDNFVETQVSDFVSLLGPTFNPSSENIVDIGGGCGFFAKAIRNRMSARVRVLDTDIKSIAYCKQAGIDAVYGDALKPEIIGDESIVCFNLILHHLVGASEPETYGLQGRALSGWHSTARAIFINEYIYESYVKNISGWLIFQITSNGILSKVGSFIARFVPSLKANTFGVGVRFRSHAEWREMFSGLGFDVVSAVIGKEEYVSFPRRLLMISSCRRDSFYLKPQSIRQDTAKGIGA